MGGSGGATAMLQVITQSPELVMAFVEPANRMSRMRGYSRSRERSEPLLQVVGYGPRRIPPPPVLYKGEVVRLLEEGHRAAAAKRTERIQVRREPYPFGQEFKAALEPHIPPWGQ